MLELRAAEAPVRDVADLLVGFAHTLRHAGVAASPDRLHAALAAIGHLDVLRPEQVYWAGRLTLCGSPDDLDRYDAAFLAYFGGDVPRFAMGRQPSRPVFRARALLARDKPGEDVATALDEPLGVAASGTEILRHRDVATLSPQERQELRDMFALLADPATRRSRRTGPASRGWVDPHRTVRLAMRHAGETTVLARRDRRIRPRRIVLLIDVSGSMAPYSDTLLRFAHALARRTPASVEVFTLGTRLTRVTRELGQRDPDRALAAASAAVPDWSGGTRLGDGLKAFLDRWGQRGTARQAVVIVCSDGWERGDPALLAEQTARLRRLARRLLWVNPHKGRDGFVPATAGMSAVLPHVDDLVAGHSLAALAELMEVVRRA